MRAAIYNPYLDTLGGGERYSLAVAKSFVQGGYEVDVQWKDKAILKKLQKRFGMDLENIRVVRDVGRGDQYDVCFWVSDGSIPTLRARKNILHFQVPFHDVSGRTLLNRMKMYRIADVVCNSYFTKRVVDKEYGVKSKVIYPPVDIKRFKAKRKENIILFVGRFSELKQSKGQDVLIKAFKRLVGGGLGDWKLVLSGGAEVGADKYLKKLRRSVGKYPIEIIESPNFRTILDLYGKSKIFWSAAGYGANEQKNPEKMEHFGITVVEAMAAKALPLVFSGGGHREIVIDGKSGYLWSTPRELLARTRSLIKNGKTLREFASSAAIASRVYEYARFEKEFLDILNS